MTSKPLYNYAVNYVSIEKCQQETCFDCGINETDTSVVYEPPEGEGGYVGPNYRHCRRSLCGECVAKIEHPSFVLALLKGVE